MTKKLCHILGCRRTATFTEDDGTILCDFHMHDLGYDYGYDHFEGCAIVDFHVTIDGLGGSLHPGAVCDCNPAQEIR